MMKYDSIYQGIVTDNKDPLGLGRVKAQFGVLGSDFDTEWLMPSAAFAGGGHGAFWPPEEGDAIHAEFLEGDPEAGVFVGGFWASPGGASEVPTEFQRTGAPTNRGFKTKSGHLLELDDLEASKAIRITSSGGHKFYLDDANGKMIMETAGGQKFEIDDAGSVINLVSSGDMVETIGGNKTINAAGDVEIKATGAAKFEGTASTDVGSASSTTMVNGTQVILGGGGPGVARVGDKAVGPGNLGIPVIVTIFIGSAKVVSG